MNTNTTTETMTYAALQADLAARWRPSARAIAAGVAYCKGADDAAAYVPMIMPGKARGGWTAGQVVLTLPQTFGTRGEAVEAAEAVLGDLDGTVGYAMVYADGTWAVWEW